MQSLLVYIPKITPRHQYVFGLIFAEIYQIEYQLTDQKLAYLNAQTSKLNYSLLPVCEGEILYDTKSLVLGLTISNFFFKELVLVKFINLPHINT